MNRRDFLTAVLGLAGLAALSRAAAADELSGEARAALDTASVAFTQGPPQPRAPGDPRPEPAAPRSRRTNWHRRRQRNRRPLPPPPRHRRPPPGR
ncbi:hypothetical protein [Bosea sp. (in: a-proteobacteria)]|uniref:hypothetical protein n=1 Tax=Bosea sp. (in: a-proteobacteria) TaxID=1871050 RepID=UPI00260F46DE|nr:hypothetical protein [Bosea sp. (in: a-proteobacteria)]MCO5091067.1 hypothetical protein [Bosea sp. (in: a-proteobacteria)]